MATETSSTQALPPLRFVTAGSVDDGKSTLIGRLLFDSKGIFEDQLAGVRKASIRHGTTGGELDLALVTDGLKAEREQGITIDVAYRYFATPRRKFIIADSPGHEQYTRNMATGASTADAAVLLVDATQGVVRQTRRHAFILALLGIRHFAVAINKMDLAGWSRETFDKIVTDFEALRRVLAERDATVDPNVTYIPLSALTGENVTSRGNSANWYEGPTLLYWLDTVDAEPETRQQPLRLPIQFVSRPDMMFRGYMGTLAGGTVQPGDDVTVLPSGVNSRVKEVFDADGPAQIAAAPQAVTVTLEDDVDASRGEQIVATDAPPQVGRFVEATLVWLATDPLVVGRSYRLKHTTRMTTATPRRIVHRVDVNTMSRESAETFAVNDVGRVVIETIAPLAFDPYKQNRSTGAFVLIDRVSNNTVAAGMILRAGEAADPNERGPVTAAERANRLNQQPAVVHLEGEDSGRLGDATIALDRLLFEAGHIAAIVRCDPASRAAVLEVLQQAGIIALIPGGESPRRGVRFTVDDPNQTPAEQAAKIFEQLQTSGVLAAPEPEWEI